MLDPAEAGISTVIWTTGFRSDWSWVDLPIFGAAGYPTHRSGVTSMDGVYVLGLPGSSPRDRAALSASAATRIFSRNKLRRV
jgi:hypothetical protein